MGHQVQQQVADVNSKFEARKSDGLATSSSLLVGAAFGLMVSLVGLSFPAQAIPPSAGGTPEYEGKPYPSFTMPGSLPEQSKVAIDNNSYIGCLLLNEGRVSMCLDMGKQTNK